MSGPPSLAYHCLFRSEVEQLLNRFCRENESNTPDFVLAQFLIESLDAFDRAVERREEWYGRTRTVIAEGPKDDAEHTSD